MPYHLHFDRVGSSGSQFVQSRLKRNVNASDRVEGLSGQVVVGGGIRTCRVLRLIFHIGDMLGKVVVQLGEFIFPFLAQIPFHYIDVVLCLARQFPGKQRIVYGLFVRFEDEGSGLFFNFRAKYLPVIVEVIVNPGQLWDVHSIGCVGQRVNTLVLPHPVYRA